MQGVSHQKKKEAPVTLDDDLLFLTERTCKEADEDYTMSEMTTLQAQVSESVGIKQMRSQNRSSPVACALFQPTQGEARSFQCQHTLEEKLSTALH
jgi:hypothetical protein